METLSLIHRVLSILDFLMDGVHLGGGLLAPKGILVLGLCAFEVAFGVANTLPCSLHGFVKLGPLQHLRYFDILFVCLTEIFLELLHRVVRVVVLPDALLDIGHRVLCRKDGFRVFARLYLREIFFGKLQITGIVVPVAALLKCLKCVLRRCQTDSRDLELRL